MDKDWTGNKQTNFTRLGARNYAKEDRQINDYYATPPKAVEELLKVENFSPMIWECACGEGHISKVLEAHGYDVCSTDLIDRGYGNGKYDFLQCDERNIDEDIITNPPYKYSKEFVEKAIEVIGEGHKVAMLLNIQFLETVKRRALFDKYPPKCVYIFTKRITCGRNGVFGNGGAMSYAWFIWEKGFKGDPIIKWVN